MADLSWLDVALRLLAAAGLGGVIGIERESFGQDAGFRTHLLLALGAAAFGAISVGAWDVFVEPRADTNVTIDVTRVAAYVPAGIGFLGAGAILKHGGTVKGITTAASLWTAASVGLAAGVGAWSTAVIATGIAVFALLVLRHVSERVNQSVQRRHDTLLVRLSDKGDIGSVVAKIQELTGGSFKQLRVGEGEGGDIEVVVQLWSNHDLRTLQGRITDLASRPDVLAVHVQP